MEKWYNYILNNMKKTLFFLFCVLATITLNIKTVSAQTNVPIKASSGDGTATASTNVTDLSSSESAKSTTSGETTSPSEIVNEKIQEKKDKDLTDTSGKQKSELALFLENNPPSELSWNNFLQHSIRKAVAGGVPANVIVLVLLFPVAATLIAASRHIVGLKGFGIYIPTVLSVAFVSTGILPGLIIFVAISLTTLLTNKIFKKTKLPYLPRTALMLWTISIGIFALLMLAPILNLTNLMSVNIFPVLILVLLSENFLDAQARSKESHAIGLTIETIVLAIISSWLLNWDLLQKLALREPELLLVVTALVSIAIGKFSGLRVSERLRFGAIIEEEE